LRIRGIFAEGEALLFGETAQGGFGLIEQWANQLNFGITYRRAGPPHSGKAFTTRAAEQTKEEQLDLVIGMVPQRNGADLRSPGLAGEEIVP